MPTKRYIDEYGNNGQRRRLRETLMNVRLFCSERELPAQGRTSDAVLAVEDNP